MPTVLLPTSYSPKEPIILFDGITIAAQRRVALKQNNGHLYRDSILVSGYKNEAALKLWVTFHTFLLNSRHTAEQYESPTGNEMSTVDMPLGNQTDFSNMLAHIYIFQPRGSIGANDRSYAELYKGFIDQSDEIIALVKNYLNDFGVRSGVYIPDKVISDPSYWQMMVYYSIVEKIVGRQPFCTETHDCSVCGKTPIPHTPMSEAKWIRKRLGEIIGDERLVKSYEEVVFAVRQKIRHDTVHSSIIPTAERDFNNPEPGLTVYDLKRSLGDYDKDHHALDSLMHMLSDVARNLLLERIYNLGIFLEPQPLNVLTMGAPGVAMSANPEHYK